MNSELSIARSCLLREEPRSEVAQLQAQFGGAATEWQAAFDAIQDVVLILTSDYRIVRANAAAATFLRCPTGQMLGRPYYALLYGTARPAEDCPVPKTLQTSHHAEAELFHEASHTPLMVSADPIRDAGGKVTRILCIARKLNEHQCRCAGGPNAQSDREELEGRQSTKTGCGGKEVMATPQHLEEVIAESSQMKQVLLQIAQVAPTASSVLIAGETGTGKELIAQLIHRLSPRKQRAMVKVNCAALPAALVESELFGREKGAYTGALTRQPGRFELADQSTIFLDEIGELSLEVQAKLLRVLQEGQFERLGSPRALKVDIRLIVATNRNLSEEVKKGRFREDLFYRLNVFPVTMPPLRERPEDLPLLVWAFVEEFGSRMGKRLTTIPRKTMELLLRYSWPGNVRELRNVIEHGVIISSGEILRVPPLEDAERTSLVPMSLAEAEREHILQALELTGWRVKGPLGAAGKLGLKPSTLYTRMQKHGIPTRRQKDQTAS